MLLSLDVSCGPSALPQCPRGRARAESPSPPHDHPVRVVQSSGGAGVLPALQGERWGVVLRRATVFVVLVNTLLQPGKRKNWSPVHQGRQWVLYLTDESLSSALVTAFQLRFGSKAAGDLGATQEQPPTRPWTETEGPQEQSRTILSKGSEDTCEIHRASKFSEQWMKNIWKEKIAPVLNTHKVVHATVPGGHCRDLSGSSHTAVGTVRASRRDSEETVLWRPQHRRPSSPHRIPGVGQSLQTRELQTAQPMWGAPVPAQAREPRLQSQPSTPNNGIVDTSSQRVPRKGGRAEPCHHQATKGTLSRSAVTPRETLTCAVLSGALIPDPDHDAAASGETAGYTSI
ncbi:hypothetical protein H920_18355 [Fukomys damarensis]|uniref:Uncharacterized protein n=1 Tax=Fukomys damarensis TaxID=885580 RepID=A0A091CR63_FUKDA|nr:hypothetical protein H920_18355 [Fukomys damarensis]